MANIIAVVDGLPIDLDLLDNGGHLDPVVFRGVTYHRWAAYFAALTWQASENVAQAAASYAATSATAVSVGIGEKLLNIGPNKGYQPGQVIVLRSASDPNVWMTGRVTAYDNATGALALEVLPGGYQGSGSYSDWTVSLGGERGPQGESGTGGVPYLWSAATAAADPGAGWLGGNGADVSTVTALYASTTANGGGDAAALLEWMGQSTNPVKGLVWLTARDNPARWAAFRIMAVTGAGGWRTVTVEYLAASSATPFVAGDQIGLAVLRAGNEGNQGPPGSGSTIMTRREGVDVGIAALLNFGAAFNLTFNNGTGQLDIGLTPEALATVGEVKQSAVPPGVGWLPCDGAAYAIAAYPSLAAALGSIKTLGTTWFPRTLPSVSGDTANRAGLYRNNVHLLLGRSDSPLVSTDTVNWQTPLSLPIAPFNAEDLTACAAMDVAGTVNYVVAVPGQVGVGAHKILRSTDRRTWAAAAPISPAYDAYDWINLIEVQGAVLLHFQYGSWISETGGASWGAQTIGAPFGGDLNAIAQAVGPNGTLVLVKSMSSEFSGTQARYLTRAGVVLTAQVCGLPPGDWGCAVYNAGVWIAAEAGSSRVAYSSDPDAADWTVLTAPIAGGISALAAYGGVAVAVSAGHEWAALTQDGKAWRQSALPPAENGYPLVLPAATGVLAIADNAPGARLAALSPLYFYDPATQFVVPALNGPGGPLAGDAVIPYIKGA